MPPCLLPARSTANAANCRVRHFIARAVVLALIQPFWPATFLSAATETAPAKPALAASLHLDARQRAVHLLNRLTYGPTPSEIEDVKRLGVDGWLKEQLHPDRISDAALEARLAAFPALQLAPETLLERFPNGAEIRQTANGKRAMPSDPVLKVIYARHVALYQAKQAEKAAQKAGADEGMAQNDVSSSATMKAAEPQPAAADVGKKRKAFRIGTEDPARGALLVQTVMSLSPEQRVGRILAMQPEEYEQFRGAMKGPQRLQMMAQMTPAERELLENFDNPTHAIVAEQQAQRLLRAIYSSRQLQEVMTGFWLNHFNVYLHKNEQEPYYLVSYERDVIRPHALGNFEDLLIATAKSPAMLLYLDNSESTGPDSAAAERQKMRGAAGKAVRKNAPQGLNENYGRELMELHTLGVNGGYTQKDVTEVAKVFTGWTVEKPGQGGGFEFDATRHEPGPKRVLGHTIQENGEQEGLAVLHMLATSTATAHFISQELAVAFVGDAPSPRLVNRMASTFLKSHGNIGAVLKTMVHAPEFWSSGAYQSKVKTPFEYVVSAARASGAQIENTQPLVNALNQMGMPLYACVPPTGYPAKATDWVSTGALVTRMNFALTLATNRYPGITTEWNADNLAQVTPELFEKTLEARLLPLGVSEKTRSAVLEQMEARAQGSDRPSLKQAAQLSEQKGNAAAQTAAASQPAAASWQNAQMAGLLLGSPEFQKR